jgi:hypothetical protein
MPTLITQSIDLHRLSSEQRTALADELFVVQQEVFDGVERAAFAKYVIDSPAQGSWIDVSRDGSGRAVAYIALHRFDRTLDGKPTAIFRAEAGTLRAFRGKAPVAGIFLRHVVPYALMHPLRSAWYLGSLVHPSSYHAFARFTAEIWPNAERANLLRFMCELGDEFGLEVVDESTPLVRHVGWITQDTEMERTYWRTCDKPTVAAFVRANPLYSQGHGLLTLVPMGTSALLRSVANFVANRVKLKLASAHVLLQRLPGFRPRVRLRDMKGLLRADEFLREIGALLIDRLEDEAQIELYRRGQVLFNAGDHGDAMYLLLEGAVYVLIGQGEDEVVVDQAGEGQAFGEMALLSGAPRSASIRTATACKLLRINAATLDKVFKEKPGTRDALWRLFDQRAFNLHLRSHQAYTDMTRSHRLDWLEAGSSLPLPSGQPSTVAGPCVLFISHGSVGVDQGDGRAEVSAPGLLHVTESLTLQADPGVSPRVIRLPPADVCQSPDAATGPTASTA